MSHLPRFLAASSRLWLFRIRKVSGIVVATGLALCSSFSGASASVDVVVSISSQTMTVEADHLWLPYNWKVSTARSGYHTPTGKFQPTWLERMHYSTLYESAPMPYSIFFSGNFAIHGTEYVRSLGKPASHGCVRLSPENAKTLYEIVKEAGRENVTIQILP